ncbi:MAG: hypothetical protein RL161_856 [Bacteroidota bacterium]
MALTTEGYKQTVTCGKVLSAIDEDLPDFTVLVEMQPGAPRNRFKVSAVQNQRNSILTIVKNSN